MMDYKESGVDIEKATEAKESIKDLLKQTYDGNVLSELGVFGSLYELKNYKNPILVSSSDGVGTKLKLAFITNKHDTIGIDLVNHCVNDILVQGARPLFFLDYLALGKMNPKTVKEIVKGLSKACKENNMALIGGETAELPDFYKEDEYDVAGFIVGVVEKDRIITGKKIEPGNVIIGLKSNGLHTNGFTLARKVLLKDGDDETIKEMMKPHKSYLKDVERLKDVDIKGMSHITGGGLIDNIPRILPENCSAEINLNWKIPKIFKQIQEKGGVDRKEMFHTFNMGIGFIIVVDEKDKKEVLEKTDGSLDIGRVIEGNKEVLLN